MVVVVAVVVVVTYEVESFLGANIHSARNKFFVFNRT
jgi:hypothetical protein